MMALLKKLFTGKDTMAEEKKEAQAVKTGKITPRDYVRGEKAEEKKEGEKKSTAALKKTATAIKSGKMSPSAYAKKEMPKKGKK